MWFTAIFGMMNQKDNQAQPTGVDVNAILASQNQPKSNTGLYLGLAAGALVLIMLVVIVIVKSK